MTPPPIPFNKPFMTGKEIDCIQEAYAKGVLSGNGDFTKKCQNYLKEKTTASCVLLTHSGTAALEIAAQLLNIEPGDEIIMPSYTFVSTATAFVQKGGIPVFVDIRPDTLNIDETKIEEAITPNTKAIVPVHYAGVACQMESIMTIAQKHNLFVIEDAAHGGVNATYQKKPLGSIGHMGIYSFHETKNITSGEGGSLIINDKTFVERAKIIVDKGTDRNKFLSGEVDKYTWVDVGSSYYPSELTAAFLWAQLQHSEFITKERTALWDKYYNRLQPLVSQGIINLPQVPEDCVHNAHMFYLILKSASDRNAFIKNCKEKGILTVFHYIPLHSSPAGKKFGKTCRSLPVTNDLSQRIVRLPLWIGLNNHFDYVIKNITDCLKDLL